MNLSQTLDRVLIEIDQHVRSSKGYETESMINPMTPVDSVSAFMVAKLLSEQNAFDYCISVAPEGHVYGYFFERCFSADVFSVHVDYPPRRCEILDDLSVIEGKRVLILEDDVASGTTLRLVLTALLEFAPKSIDLYLGRAKDSQCIEHIDDAVQKVYLAEDLLDSDQRAQHESTFVDFFVKRFTREKP